MNRSQPAPYNIRTPINASVLGTDRSEATGAFFFILLHIPLALALRWNPVMATVHALFTILIGLAWVFRTRKIYSLVYLIAYIMGAELLWRGTHASVFWEYGKYATSVLMILTILTQGRLIKADKRPLIYFVLLLPSIMVMPAFDRVGIAFNLSGPFSLAVAAMFFSGVKLTQVNLRRVFVAVIAPIVGLGFLATYQTVAAEAIRFTGSSIRATSAGIGPNQVSSILGLGALVAFLYLFVDRQHKSLRVLMIGCTIWLLAQAALTFSRGGVWTAIGAIGVAIFYLLRNRKSRTIFVSTSTVIFLVGYFFVFPALEDFTGRTLGARFQSFESTGRDKIVKGDLLAFNENPLLGVGPGQSKAYHSILFRASSAHIEYTRLLAEHGSLGLLALLVLVSMSLKRFLGRSHAGNKAYIVSFTVWALLFMAHSAMRLVAPSIMFGLGAVTISTEAEALDK